jgi:hypothetical protein
LARRVKKSRVNFISLSLLFFYQSRYESEQVRDREELDDEVEENTERKEAEKDEKERGRVRERKREMRDQSDERKRQLTNRGRGKGMVEIHVINTLFLNCETNSREADGPQVPNGSSSECDGHHRFSLSRMNKKKIALKGISRITDEWMVRRRVVSRKNRGGERELV